MEVYKESQNQINIINKWIEQNKLTINIGKTYYMFYHKTKIKKNEVYNINKEEIKLKIEDNIVERVKDLNFLGIII